MQLGEYIGKDCGTARQVRRRRDQPHAEYRTKQRKFGLIYLEGIKGKVDPEGKRAADALTSEMAKYGGQVLDGDRSLTRTTPAVTSRTSPR